MAIYLNLSKQVQKLSLNHLHYYLTTTNIQLKILCLQLSNFTFLKF